MPLFSASLDTYIFTSIAIAIPWLFYTSRSQKRSHVHKPTAQDVLPPPPTKEPRYRPLLSALILIHTLFILHSLIISPPPNLFTALNLPLNTPTDKIRATLMEHAQITDPDALPRLLQTLLKRLASFDMRTLYVRFGQAVLQTCEYCETYDEYALYALSRPLPAYIRETAVVGLVTIRGTHRERWRTLGIGAVVLAAVLEGYWISSVGIRIPRQGDSTHVTMWHDLLYTCRSVLFLLLPAIIHILPPSPPTLLNPLLTLPSTLATLESALTRLHLLKYTRGALMRLDPYREQAGAWWEVERREGTWVREDEDVKRIAEKEGFGFGEKGEGGGEGKLRTNAKMAVSALNQGFKPSEHWKTT